MKILVTGGQGQLGTTFAKLKEKIALPFDYKVFALGKEEVNILDYHSIEQVVRKYQIDTIVNTAAVVDPDIAENDEDLAYRLNVAGVQNIASVCLNKNIKMVQISTDYVFDGNKNLPYKEFDQKKPLNVYGQTKLIAESVCQSICHKSIIVRTGVLYGEKENFVTKIIKSLQKGETIKTTTDQYGCPTYTYDLAKTVMELIKSDIYGTFHVVNTGKVTRYEFAKEIVRLFGLDKIVLKQFLTLKSAELKRPALRPLNTELENYMLKILFKKKMRSWQEALAEYISTIK